MFFESGGCYRRVAVNFVVMFSVNGQPNRSVGSNDFMEYLGSQIGLLGILPRNIHDIMSPFFVGKKFL